MASKSKRAKLYAEKVERTRLYPVDEALTLIKELAGAKFPESVDVAVNLGVDPRKSDQVVRGSTVLPNGTGKTVRVAVFAQGPNAEVATEAGADGADSGKSKLQRFCHAKSYSVRLALGARGITLCSSLADSVRNLRILRAA